MLKSSVSPCCGRRCLAAPQEIKAGEWTVVVVKEAGDAENVQHIRYALVTADDDGKLQATDFPTFAKLTAEAARYKDGAKEVVEQWEEDMEGLMQPRRWWDINVCKEEEVHMLVSAIKEVHDRVYHYCDGSSADIVEPYDPTRTFIKRRKYF